jgi:hypothetical protein
MDAGARTPEELETLMEDAYVLRDLDALSVLFENGTVFVANGHVPIQRTAGALWPAVRSYVSEPRRIVQSGVFALLLGERTAGVLHRGTDRSWRYAICFLDVG